MLAGRVTFSGGGETLDAQTGSLVFIDDPAERRAAVAVEDGTIVLAIGGLWGSLIASRRGSSGFVRVPRGRERRPARPAGLSRRDSLLIRMIRRCGAFQATAALFSSERGRRSSQAAARSAMYQGRRGLESLAAAL